MNTTVWQLRVKATGSALGFYPSAEEARASHGTAYAHLYSEPEPIEKDVVFLLMRDDGDPYSSLSVYSAHYSLAGCRAAQEAARANDKCSDFDIEIVEMAL